MSALVQPKIVVTFIPWKRPNGRYSIQVVIDGEPQQKFLHWIENSTRPHTCCTTNRGDICHEIFSFEECEANCNWLNAAFERGEIV